MIDNGGELYITTGYKAVSFAYTDMFGKKAELICRGNQNLVGGLLAQKFAERMFKLGPEHTIVTETINGRTRHVSGKPLTTKERFLHHRFKITDAGRKAAGRKQCQQ